MASGSTSSGCSAVLVYAIVSLFTCREDFNLDRVLHRGQWRIREYEDTVVDTAAAPKSRGWFKATLGIDEHFTFADKFQTYVIFGWTMFWFAIFIAFTVWNLLWRWPTQWWTTYWHIIGIWLPLIVGILTTVWFTIGGLHDLRVLFKRLDKGHTEQSAASPSHIEPAEEASERVGSEVKR